MSNFECYKISRIKKEREKETHQQDTREFVYSQRMNDEQKREVFHELNAWYLYIAENKCKHFVSALNEDVTERTKQTLAANMHTCTWIVWIADPLVTSYRWFFSNLIAFILFAVYSQIQLKYLYRCNDEICFALLYSAHMHSFLCLSGWAEPPLSSVSRSSLLSVIHVLACVLLIHFVWCFCIRLYFFAIWYLVSVRLLKCPENIRSVRIVWFVKYGNNVYLHCSVSYYFDIHCANQRMFRKFDAAHMFSSISPKKYENYWHEKNLCLFQIYRISEKKW